MTQLAATAVSEEIPRLAQAGKVSSLFAVGSFRPASDYPAAMVERAVAEAHREFGGPAALTVQRKLNGDPNFNHLFYRDLSRQLMADSIAAAQERPDLFGRQILQGLRIFFQPASFYPNLSGNRERLYLLDVAYFAVAYPMGTFLLVQIVLVASLVSSGVIAIRGARARGQSTAALRPAAAYVFVTVAWVAMVGNIAEYGENMRFRFTVDPLIVLWLAIVLTQLAPKLMLEKQGS